MHYYFLLNLFCTAGWADPRPVLPATRVSRPLPPSVQGVRHLNDFQGKSLCDGRLGAAKILPCPHESVSKHASLQLFQATSFEGNIWLAFKTCIANMWPPSIYTIGPNLSAEISDQAKSMHVQIDFNLFGMGFIRLEDVTFRRPVPTAATPKRTGWHEIATEVHHELSPSGKLLGP